MINQMKPLLKQKLFQEVDKELQLLELHQSLLKFQNIQKLHFVVKLLKVMVKQKLLLLHSQQIIMIHFVVMQVDQLFHKNLNQLVFQKWIIQLIKLLTVKKKLEEKFVQEDQVLLKVISIIFKLLKKQLMKKDGYKLEILEKLLMVHLNSLIEKKIYSNCHKENMSLQKKLKIVIQELKVFLKLLSLVILYPIIVFLSLFQNQHFLNNGQPNTIYKVIINNYVKIYFIYYISLYLFFIYYYYIYQFIFQFIKYQLHLFVEFYIKKTINKFLIHYLYQKINQISFIQKQYYKTLRDHVLKLVNEQGKQDNLNGFEQIKNVYLEPRPFMQVGILTETMKMQRHKARSHYQDIIKFLYSEI